MKLNPKAILNALLGFYSLQNSIPEEELSPLQKNLKVWIEMNGGFDAVTEKIRDYRNNAPTELNDENN